MKIIHSDPENIRRIPYLIAADKAVVSVHQGILHPFSHQWPRELHQALIKFQDPLLVFKRDLSVLLRSISPVIPMELAPPYSF